MSVDIAGLRALIAAATDGPWELQVVHPYMDGTVQARIARRGQPKVCADVMKFADAQFLATARTALPDALDEIERLQAEVERLTAANANLIHNAEVLADELVLGTTPEYSAEGNVDA